MTLPRRYDAGAYSRTADAYAATMAPSLRPVAERVVAAAGLREGEDVLDLGTGPGTAAGLARGGGRRVVGLDAAAGMLEIARRNVPDAVFLHGDFTDLPFAEASFDVVMAVHALLFAEDRQATLAAWRAVTRPGGRLSISVPGPGDRVPISIFAPVYDAYGLSWGSEYPTQDDLVAWADAAGWQEIGTDADPDVRIRLRDERAFDLWLLTGSRGRATGDWSASRREALARDLLAASPRDPDGWISLPFGALYLTARRIDG